MTRPTKAPTPPASGELAAQPEAWPSLTPPWTTEERLRSIATMLQRLNGYVEFMSGVATLNGTSAEAKEKAVTAFYERMVVLERQLGRIQEELRLG